MFTIKDKKNLAPNVTLLKIDAPYIVKNAKPGQFVILRVEENGERILAIAREACVRALQIHGPRWPDLDKLKCLCLYLNRLSRPDTGISPVHILSHNRPRKSQDMLLLKDFLPNSC